MISASETFSAAGGVTVVWIFLDEFVDFVDRLVSDSGHIIDFWIVVGSFFSVRVPLS
ncbi:MAG: hypothetical protein U5O15_00010 [Candidatus Krumholzibacteriota bacterium]|nr:hypothetical protein [Candidatus Krumholzibacteriota bacterium]